MNIQYSSLIAHVPEIFILTSSSILLLYATAYATSKVNIVESNVITKRDEGSISSSISPLIYENVLYLAILSFIYTLILTLNSEAFSTNFYIADKYAILIKALLISATGLTLLMSVKYLLDTQLNAFEYILLICLTLTGLLFLISAHDLITFYLALELQSLGSYVLAAIKRRSIFSTEAAVKYFVLGALSSGFLLLGASLIYGFTGTTQFEAIALQFAGLHAEGSHEVSTSLLSSAYLPYSLYLGLLLVSVALLFKLAAVPFHMWAPDVYEGSPMIITAYFTIVPKLGVLATFIRFIYSCGPAASSFTHAPLQNAFLFCAISSMIIGTLGAIYQTRIKRLFAYSAIGHMGYILMAFATGNIAGAEAIFFYMIIYIVMMLGVFSILLAVWKYNWIYISDFHGLARRQPILALIFSILLLSIAGVPPLAGFFSKFYVFFAALGSNMYFTIFVGVLTSSIGAYYSIRIIKNMFVGHGVSLASSGREHMLGVAGMAGVSSYLTFRRGISSGYREISESAGYNRAPVPAASQEVAYLFTYPQAVILALSTLIVIGVIAYPTPIFALASQIAFSLA